MKKTRLAATIVIALTSGSAYAGFIQIDPTGSGSIAASTALTGLGSSIGDMVLDNMITSGQTGTVYGQNVIDLTSTIGGEMTFVFGFSAASTPQKIDTGGGVLIDNLNSADVTLATGVDAKINYFKLYYNAALGTADTRFGMGYDTGVLLASGTVSILKDAGGTEQFGVSKQTGSASALADNNATLSVPVTGAAVLNIDFTSKNPAYVVNDITGLTIDLVDTNSLNAPYTKIDDRAGKGYADGIYAASKVGGTATGVSAAFGADGVNDFACRATPNGTSDPTLGGTCDLQLQMNSTLTFNAKPVPEPNTIAILGLGLGLLGFARARAKKS